jgi:hypothetical protein
VNDSRKESWNVREMRVYTVYSCIFKLIYIYIYVCVCIYIYIILKSRGFFPKGFRWRDKVGNGVGAEERRLRSVQYTIQATEYHDSRVKKLDHPLLTRAATPGPSSFLNFLLYLSSISYCYLLVLSSTMRLALLRAQDRVRAPKEATIIMRGLSKFPKIRRN